MQLRLSSIIRDGSRYSLDIVEQKTKKKREFTVLSDIYIYIQNYALENNISPVTKLFDIGERAVNKHLKLVCNYLKMEGIGSYSFSKYFATSIYVNNNYDINLLRVLLQHSSTAVTQRYIGIPVKTMHKIRKTCAAPLLHNGVNLSIVRDMSGHADEATTLKHYIFNVEGNSETDNIVLAALEGEKQTKSDQKIVPFPEKKEVENLEKSSGYRSVIMSNYAV